MPENNPTLEDLRQRLRRLDALLDRSSAVAASNFYGLSARERLALAPPPGPAGEPAEASASPSLPHAGLSSSEAKEEGPGDVGAHGVRPGMTPENPKFQNERQLSLDGRYLVW